MILFDYKKFLLIKILKKNDKIKKTKIKNIYINLLS